MQRSCLYPAALDIAPFNMVPRSSVWLSAQAELLPFCMPLLALILVEQHVGDASLDREPAAGLRADQCTLLQHHFHMFRTFSPWCGDSDGAGGAGQRLECVCVGWLTGPDQPDKVDAVQSKPALSASNGRAWKRVAGCVLGNYDSANTVSLERGRA